MKNIILTLLAFLLLLAEVQAQTIDTLPCGERQRNFFYSTWYDTSTFYLNPDDPYANNTNIRTVSFFGVFDYAPTSNMRTQVYQQYSPDSIVIKGIWAMVSQDANGAPDCPYNSWFPVVDSSRLPEYFYLYVPNPKVDTSLLSEGDTARYLLRVATVRWDTAHPKMLCVQRSHDDRFGNANNQYCHLYQAMLDTAVTVQGEFWIGGTINSNSKHILDHPTGHWHFPVHYLSWGCQYYYNYLTPYKRMASGLTPDGPFDWDPLLEDHVIGHGPFGAIVDLQFFVEVASADTSQGWAQYSAYYPDSSHQTITAVPRRGYRFTHWGDGVTDNPRTILVTQDTLFTAHFEPLPLYRVSATSNDDMLGHVTGDSVYYEGDTATLRAVTDFRAAHFVMWDDSVADNPRAITVVSDTAFTALFALKAPQSVEGPSQEAAPRFSLTPNPARGSVVVTVPDPRDVGGGSTLTLSDASGRRLLTLPVTDPQLTLSLASYPAGPYFLTLTTPQGSSTQKLVVE